MKKIFLTILMLTLAFGVSAQKHRDKQTEKVSIGIKVGGNLANYHYYPDPYELNDLGLDSIGKRLNPMFGLSVEIPLLKGVVLVSPEVMFNVRGDSRLFRSSTADTLVRYQAKVNYLELRVPVAIAIPVTKSFKPYVFAAPSFSMALDTLGPFESAITQTNVGSVGVSASNMAPYDYGIALGLGFRYRLDLTGFSMLLKLEGGYYCGMKDTFSEKEIIRIYRKRCQIEVFFKTCKSYLNLVGECHSLSYDALTAHVAIVFTRYLMMAVEQRRSEDERTLGEIFYFFTDELADITFGESFQIIITAMIESVCAIFQPTEEQLELFIEMFVGRLPDYLRNSLAKAAMAA